MANFCSRCGARLDSSAKFCSSCGASVVSEPSEEQTIYDEDSIFPVKSEFSCPNCGSENIQSLPIIFQSGTSGSSSVMVADKFISVSKGMTMTNLARSIAPPTQKENNWWWTALSALLTLLLMDAGDGLLFLIFLCVTGYFLKENWDVYNYNNNVWPKLYDTWLHSYLCRRCGNIFVVR